ncbi:MAG: hypothetical protein ACLFTK_12870 [Anaerolineales bacterium]
MRSLSAASLTTVVLLGIAGLVAFNLAHYPLANGRDEADHLRLIHHYAATSSPPTLPDDLASASIQGHQPPLYYTLTALLLRLGVPDPVPPGGFVENPFLLRDNYNPDLPAYNRVFMVHFWRVDAPAARGMLILRFFSVALHLLALAFIWRAAHDLLPPDVARWAAPLALAFIMLTPSFARTAITVNNNALLFFWGAVWLAGWARIYRHGWTPRRAIGLGLVLGLAALTKVYALPLFATVPILAGVSGGRGRWRYSLIILGLGMLIGGPWYARNLALYDDLTAANITEDLLDSRRAQPFGIPDVAQELFTWPGELWLESWLILNDTTTRDIANGLGVILLTLALVGWGLALRHACADVRSAILLGVLWLVGLGGVVLAAARNLHGAYSPPLLLATLPAGALGLSAGWLYLAPQRRGLLAWGALTIILATSILFQAYRVAPLYVTPNTVTTQGEPFTFENGVRLTAYHLPPGPYAPGQWIYAQLCWAATETIDTTPRTTFSAQLVAGDGTRAAIQDGYHLSGRFPAAVWRPSDAFCERVPLRIAPHNPTPRAYDLVVSVYDLDDGPVPYVLPDGRTETLVPLLQRAVIAPDDAPPGETIAQADDWARLTQLDITRENDTLALDVAWAAIGTAPGRYHVFIHVLNADGERIAQADMPPFGGRFPTDLWARGAYFTTRYAVPAPAEAESIAFGLYDLQTGRRAIWQDGADALRIPLA